jgi:hypothetical protein
MLINELNSGYSLSPMFADVRLGCRQNCRQHQFILALKQKEEADQELIR